MRQEDLHRVILHLDFDSYYTQVEMKRLGIPAETPCAVQQWEGLIAVNYPARARGITRHMRVKEAKKICPELVLVHVETIGADAGSEGATDADTSTASPAPGAGGAAGAAAAAAAAAAAGGSSENRRLTQKACLERYRRSTAEVLVLLHRLAPGCTIEKASIDEVYMDVTSMVDQEVTQVSCSACQQRLVLAMLQEPLLLAMLRGPAPEAAAQHNDAA
jgi:DNA polymerase eta